MMILLALPQPGAPPALPPVTSAARAETACSSSIEPRLRPSRPDPPTRRISRRVMPSCGSHRSFPACPGTMIIVSLLFTGLVGLEKGKARMIKIEFSNGTHVRLLPSKPRRDRVVELQVRHRFFDFGRGEQYEHADVALGVIRKRIEVFPNQVVAFLLAHSLEIGIDNTHAHRGGVLAVEIDARARVVVLVGAQNFLYLFDDSVRLTASDSDLHFRASLSQIG